MYNMDISIGSYKFRLEIIVLIVIVSWILYGHLLCGCSRVSFMEGFAVITETYVGTNSKSPPNRESPSSSSSSGQPPKGVQYYMTHPEKGVAYEHFTNANNSAMGPEFAGARTPDYIMNPSTWSMPTLTYSPGTTPDAGVKAIWDRPKQPIPLPKDELDMFATTPFKPECCPNAYSSSMGCACMTVDQYSYLRERGANNVPYSEY